MELQQLRTTGDTVLIHIPQRLEETITVAGRALWFDPTWREMETKHLRGVLVAVPEEVGNSYLLSRKGFAGGRVGVDAIQEVLQVGDQVYADWTVSEDHGKVKLADFELPGVGGVYRATLNQLVARVREGVLEPFGSYVLCKEVWPPDIEEVELPGFPGKMRLRVSPTSGLTLGSEDIPPLPWQGEVTHVGLPLRGQPARVKVGDRVVFDKAMCGKDNRPMKLKLEGIEYLCIRQDYIAAVLEEVVPAPVTIIIGECMGYENTSKTLSNGITVQALEFLPNEMGADLQRYQRDRHLVTTCCGADHIHMRAEDSSAVLDYCNCCKQVAHLIPLDEFSTNKPSA